MAACSAAILAGAWSFSSMMGNSSVPTALFGLADGLARTSAIAGALTIGAAGRLLFAGTGCTGEATTPPCSEKEPLPGPDRGSLGSPLDDQWARPPPPMGDLDRHPIDIARHREARPVNRARVPSTSTANTSPGG